jgi:hypothetical protein
MNDLLLPLLTQLGSCTAATWALTEVVGRVTSVAKTWLALAIGPATAATAYGLGFVPLVTATGVKGYAAAGFAGLIATLTAKAFHDLIANPLLRRLGGGNAE